jgi:hypothetical protein
MLVKTFKLSLTTATPAKSVGLGETNRLGYAILGFAFNRGFFDIILPTALIYLLPKYISIIGIVKSNLEKIFFDLNPCGVRSYGKSAPANSS